MAAEFDLIIVGASLNGAIAATLVRERDPLAKILVIEAGRPISGVPGEHLVEAGTNAMHASYESLMRRARQIDYVSDASTAASADNPVELTPGVYPAAWFGNDTAQFRGSSFGWNVGGMGVHWTAACPTPFAEEVPTFLREAEWAVDLNVASGLLRVARGPLVDNPFSERIIEGIRSAVPTAVKTREFGYMPLAGEPREGAPLARTGPRDIAPWLFDGTDEHSTLLTSTLATRLALGNGRVTHICVRNLETEEEQQISGRQFLIAADTLRTPQLLWASGIRPEALGVRLNEHASIDGDVLVDASRLGLDGVEVPSAPAGEPFIGAYWSPSIGSERPMHGQLMERLIPEIGHVLGVSWYCATEIRPENRVSFSDDEQDILGMPRMRIDFSYSETDLAWIERTKAVQKSAADAIGVMRAESEVLPPGASLHYTGTVRMGPQNDGTSVCDTDGRVWGTDNLYVAGNGVIPTALTCNATLTGATLTVRTARALDRAHRSS